MVFGNLLTMTNRDGTWTMEDEGVVSLRSHKICVEVIRGPLEGRVFELPGPTAWVGSGKNCDLSIPDPTVSGQHVKIAIQGDLIRVIDEKSRNGTLVDDVRIRDAYARPDSTISIGASAMRFRMIPDIVELPLSTRDHFGGLYGSSIAMRRMYALLERVADTEMTVLVEGETGTGKDLVAAAIHEASQRAEAPFVIFDCAAVPRELAESELFGHERGAFTGAVGVRKGRFREAEGGTLFLDEIGELPMELQPKLLRALESRTIRPVGADKEVRTNVRVVAATNRNLALEVERNRFREDLFYRLAVVQIRVPPLRERVDDIPMLVRHFEQTLVARGKAAAPLPKSSVTRMMGRAWPGNVRELRNKVELLLSLGLGDLPDIDEDEVQPGNVPLEVDLDIPFHRWIERISFHHTRAYFDAALKKSDGNVTRTAAQTGVSRAFVQRIMRRHALGIDKSCG